MVRTWDTGSVKMNKNVYCHAIFCTQWLHSREIIICRFVTKLLSFFEYVEITMPKLMGAKFTKLIGTVSKVKYEGHPIKNKTIFIV